MKIQWPDLLNDTVAKCLTPHTEQGGSSDTKLKAHLSEGDDSTIYLHTMEDDGSPPEMVLTDFAQLVKTAASSQQQSPMQIPAVMLPPSYVPPGQPPNAPIRKSQKTAEVIVTEDNSSDEDVPLATSAAYAKKTVPEMTFYQTRTE